MNMLSTLAAAGASGAPPPGTGAFALDVDGDGRSTNVTNRQGAPGAVTVEHAVHSGDPAFRDVRLAYDLQAEAAGLDPATIRPGSAEDRQVVADLGHTLGRVAAQPRSGGVASAMSDLRAEARATVALRTAAETGLTASAIASAAHAPGASLAANALPVTRALLDSAGALRRTPATSVAAGVGTIGGVAIALGAGKLNEAAAPIARDRIEARAALDTDRDGKLQCREIGTWEPEAQTGWSENAKAYQAYVNGRAGMDFRLTVGKKADVDGCSDEETGAKLLEAKGDQGKPLQMRNAQWSDAPGKIVDQGERGRDAANLLGVSIEWHVQTRHDTDVITRIFQDAEIDVPVIHDPAPSLKPR